MRLWLTTWHENKAVRKNIASIQRTYAYFHSSPWAKSLSRDLLRGANYRGAVPMYGSVKTFHAALLLAAILAFSDASGRGAEFPSPVSRNTAAKRPVTIADAIEMTKLADEDYFLGGTASGRVPQFSPDRKQFVIVLRKGNIEQDTNDFSLLLYQTSDAFDAPKPDVLVKMSTSSAYRGAIRGIRWLDNEMLAFLGETATEPSQVYTFNIPTRVLKKMTNHPTSIQTYDMTKDGHEVIFSAEAPAKNTKDQER